jgi:TRAP-type C4-dicarboxylate transport system substrate-binding protein
MKRGYLLLFPVALVAAMCLCLQAGAMAAETKEEGARVVKIATLAPDGTVWMKAMHAMADYVEKASSGKLRVKFYTGGVMGDEPDVVRKMKLGQLDGSGVSLTGVRLTCPEFQVLEMPFLFRSRAFDEVEYIYEKLEQEFDRYAEKNGYKIIALGSAGFAHICSSQQLTSVLKDLPLQKVWQWEGETVMMGISRSLGLPTISLPLPDTLTALQTGMINAFYGTPIHALAFQWNKYINYIYKPAIFYTPSYVVVTQRSWNSIPPDIQALFFDEQAKKIKYETLRWIHRDDEKCLEVLQKGGTKVVEIAPEEVEQIKQRTRKVMEEMSGKHFPAELLEKVQRLLEEYRAGKAAPPVRPQRSS